MKRTKLFAKLSKVVYALFIMAAVSITFTACDDTEDAEPAPEDSILEIVTTSTTHTQLLKFVSANDGLVNLLGGNNLTLFAPNDDAFEKLRVTLGVASLEQVNPAVISAVLAFHVYTAGVVLRADITAESALTTVQGEAITINASTGNIATGGSDTDVEFVGDEILATNGVVHVVETILIPPTIFATIGANLGKVSQTILLGADFSTLAAAIGKADAGFAAETEGVTPLSAILANADLALTVFAPVNQVFEAGQITLDTYTAQQWYGIIANHVLLSKRLSTSLVVGEGMPTAAGGAITLLPSGGLDSNGISGAEASFIEGAIDIESSNGVVHAIAGVLAPAAAGRYAIDEIYTK
jgi:uncharacterized surface protein with fasciclin (FAS1) repeats